MSQTQTETKRTSYVVLAELPPAPGRSRSFHVVDVVLAYSAGAAVDAIEHVRGDATLIAIPESNWNEFTVTVEQPPPKRISTKVEQPIFDGGIVEGDVDDVVGPITDSGATI